MNILNTRMWSFRRRLRSLKKTLIWQTLSPYGTCWRPLTCRVERHRILSRSGSWLFAVDCWGEKKFQGGPRSRASVTSDVEWMASAGEICAERRGMFPTMRHENCSRLIFQFHSPALVLYGRKRGRKTAWLFIYCSAMKTLHRILFLSILSALLGGVHNATIIMPHQLMEWAGGARKTMVCT